MRGLRNGIVLATAKTSGARFHTLSHARPAMTWIGRLRDHRITTPTTTAVANDDTTVITILAEKAVHQSTVAVAGTETAHPGGTTLRRLLR